VRPDGPRSTANGDKDRSHLYLELAVYRLTMSPVSGLEWPRGFQEVKVPRFSDNGIGWW